jgi:hypothetical protein
MEKTTGLTVNHAHAVPNLNCLRTKHFGGIQPRRCCKFRHRPRRIYTETLTHDIRSQCTLAYRPQNQSAHAN